MFFNFAKMAADNKLAQASSVLNDGLNKAFATAKEGIGKFLDSAKPLLKLFGVDDATFAGLAGKMFDAMKPGVTQKFAQTTLQEAAANGTFDDTTAAMEHLGNKLSSSSGFFNLVGPSDKATGDLLKTQKSDFLKGLLSQFKPAIESQ
jgi:hypothetical protein